MKKTFFFAAIVSLLMTLSCNDNASGNHDALEGDNNGTNIGPGKGSIERGNDSTNHDHDTTSTNLH